jgi:hypothetical protein
LPAWPVALFLALSCTAGWAQREPRIGYVFPAGIARGDQIELTVGGQFLDGVTNAVFSTVGLQAEVLEHKKPLTQREINALRERLQKLLKAKPAERDQTAIAELRRQLARPKQPPSPQLAERVRLRITAWSDTGPGAQELRLQVGAGLTNPLQFRVSDLPERLEVEAKDREALTDDALELPFVMNGQILPGDVDRFRFRGHSGQRVVVKVEARALIPYLADAVPGWFQATLALYDVEGHELAYADDRGFNPDPLLAVELPSDGEYEVEIRDAIYRGREDFVYRMTIGEVPWVSSVFPLGGPSGATTDVQVRGWNLPERDLQVDLSDTAAGFVRLPLGDGSGTANSRWFAVDTLQETTESEPNNRLSRAQAVPVNSIVNGRIDYSGDSDLFRIKGQSGQVVVAEVLARRLSSPLDSFLRITDLGGVELARNDDTQDRRFGWLTHHADAYVQWKLPAEGECVVWLTDTQNRGSVAHAYRLRLSVPRPHFELRAFPSALNLPPGGTAPFTVLALRRDGFDGDLSVTLKGAPKGFRLSGGWVPSGQDRIRCTLTAPTMRVARPLKLQLEGHARVGDQVVTRAVVPSDDLMQAFVYRHLIPSEGWYVNVTGRPGRRAPLGAFRVRPVELPVGGRIKIPLVAGNSQRSLPQGFGLELSEPPAGLKLGNLVRSERGWEMEVEVDGKEAEPGLKGNLIVRAFIERKGVGNAGSAGRRMRKTFLGFLPAIPFELTEMPPTE